VKKSKLGEGVLGLRLQSQPFFCGNLVLFELILGSEKRFHAFNSQASRHRTIGRQ
jgi:hypothetical protein